MVCIQERLTDRHKPEQLTRRPSVHDKVVDCLRSLGISTDIGPYFSLQMNENMREHPPYSTFGDDKYGEPIEIYHQGYPPMDSEKAAKRARETAPLDLSRDIEEQLIRMGVGDFEAKLLASVASGMKVKRIAGIYSITPENVYYHIGRFIKRWGNNS
jgi:hypothetical protein